MRDGGEGLVDLEQVDVGDGEPCLLQELLNRADRRGREPLRRLRDAGVARRCARSASSRRPSPRSSLATTSAAAPSLILEEFAAVTDPVLLEGRLRVFIFSSGAANGSSSASTRTGSPFFCGTSTGAISVGEEASLHGVLRAPVGLQRVVVLLLARELVLRHALLGAVAHVHVLVRIPQAVLDHRDRRARRDPSADPCAPSRAGTARSTSTPCRPRRRARTRRPGWRFRRPSRPACRSRTPCGP